MVGAVAPEGAVEAAPGAPQGGGQGAFGKMLGTIVRMGIMFALVQYMRGNKKPTDPAGGETLQLTAG